MGKAHVLAIPYPAQGHVIPMLEFVQCLAKQGVKITFVNTDVTHELVTNALLDKISHLGNQIHMVSIPDGVESSEDRKDMSKFLRSIVQVMPGKLVELIEKINGTDEDKLTCLIADAGLGWAISVAHKIGIRPAIFCVSSAATQASVFSMQKLIDDGIINKYGTPVKEEMIQLSPSMPAIKSTNLAWCIGELNLQEALFEAVDGVNKAVKVAEWVLCNSSNELEPAAFVLFPYMLPIGPLLASSRLGNQAGSFWQEDLACLTWLDQQADCSVIYVAFGSTTTFDQTQFDELALGLELTNRPFLWVVRPGMTMHSGDVYPKGYTDRIGDHAQMVSWAPQQKVLSHPSVACFMSHCGWNSTLEGVSNGIPFLCWPYFCDQFHNQTYICDVWKNGLGFNKDETGIVTRSEIKNKVEQLLSNEAFKSRAMDLKEKVATSIGKGGSSYNNLRNFVHWVKDKDVHFNLDFTQAS